jgi:hypothetical protein
METMTNADLARILYDGAAGGNQLYLEKLRIAFDAGKKEWKIDEKTTTPVSFDFMWEHRDLADAKVNILKLATQGLIPMIDELMTALNVHGLTVRIKRSAATGVYLFRGELPRSQTAWRKGTTDLEETKQMARRLAQEIEPERSVEFILEDDAAT